MKNVVAWLRHFAVRLAGQRGDAAILLASMSIRAVALGVVLTALIQAVIGGIGLGISGVPYATVLTVLMFICCLAQLGPLFVLVPSILWLFWTGDTTWGYRHDHLGVGLWRRWMVYYVHSSSKWELTYLWY